jgi:peptide/nickel transport system permease protein
VRYFGQRLLQFLIVFFIVTFGVMVLLRLGLDAPGDPARTLLGGAATQEQIDATTEKYHLDSNYLVQYWYWLKGMLTGDFGYSVTNNLPVADLMKPRVMTTVLLGFYAMTIGIGIAVPLGVYQAYRRDRFFDRAASLVTFMLISVTTIVLAVFLKLAFIEGWEVFPRLGDKVYPWEDLGEHFKNFFLPTMTLAIPIAAVLTRLLRSDMSLTLQSDFISLARAKGMSPNRILWRHALRNSLFSLITALGIQLGALIGGAVIAETFFDLDGMGTMLVVATLSSDLFTVQATVAIIVVAVVFVNLVIDLLYAVIDPRIRMARSLA